MKKLLILLVLIVFGFSINSYDKKKISGNFETKLSDKSPGMNTRTDSFSEEESWSNDRCSRSDFGQLERLLSSMEDSRDM